MPAADRTLLRIYHPRMPDGHGGHLLRLTLVPELGPVRIARLIARFGSAEAVLGASGAQIEAVKGLGRKLSSSIAREIAQSEITLKAELDLIAEHRVTLLAKGGPGYPALLTPFEDAPPILYVRGSVAFDALDAFPVAIVGSRRCSAYGYEQATRFAFGLASAGLTVVSGGARGIDTASHKGALNASGRTIVVQGCGLAHTYPPENRALYDDIVGGRGGIVSEMPMAAAPDAKNFPARNRIISGISLGVIVIEAQEGSGSLITARLAAEDHGREVMAVPGRVDSPASKGTHALLKQGGAALVTDPSDVLEILEVPARHAFEGTHEHRYGPLKTGEDKGAEGGLFTADPATSSDEATRILQALRVHGSIDAIAESTGLATSQVLSHLTLLQIQGRAVRGESVWSAR